MESWKISVSGHFHDKYYQGIYGFYVIPGG